MEDTSRFVPHEQRSDGQKNARRGRSAKSRRKHRIERRCINELHRGNALLGWEAGKAIHDEGRKSEKDAGHQSAAECRDKRQRKE
jgi:hypothetical protein